MELKPVFGRPRVDLALRVLVVVAFAILAVAVVLDGDLRQVVVVVGLAAFATIQLVVLSPAADNVAHVIMWASMVAWLAVVVA